MNREGVINILRKLESDIPPGLTRYKLIEQLRLMWSPGAGLRHRSLWSRLKRVRRQAGAKPGASVQMRCCKCGYDLEGLESSFGPELPIGPSQCPECGVDFPAIW
ncbi:MAG: hypothetical protein ACF8K1_02535 [Phycisphaerales bacterium JB047]